MSGDTLRILIVAGDPLARAGLAALLAGQPGCLVVGQAAPDADLQAEAAADPPDALLWDLGWEPRPALALLAEAGADLPPVVALLAEPDEATAAVQAWQAGARGLLARTAPPERLAAALAAAASGLVVWELGLPPGAGAGDPLATSPELVEDLTPRELEVLQLLTEGLTNRAMALRLGISEHTVKFHVNAILGKLGVGSRTEAVVRATRLGLVRL